MDRLTRQSPLWTIGIVCVALAALAVSFERPGTAKSMLGAGALVAILTLVLAEAGIKIIRDAATLKAFATGVGVFCVGAGTTVFALRYVLATGHYEILVAMVFWSILYAAYFRTHILGLAE